MLDFRMDTFLAVCKHMNFTKAAEELNITQPAVSHHIHYLEEHYKAKLFEYSGKKLGLTEAGKTLLSAATTMKHDELHLKQALKMSQGSGRRLVFGATMTVGEYVIPEALMRLMDAQPDVSVKMVVADTQDLLKRLDEGEIEFAVVEGFFQKREYDFLVYDRGAFVIVASPEYRFRKNVRVIEDLTQERFFIREPGSGTRYVFERYLEGKNLLIHDFTDLMEISNIGAIKSLVADGRGITFLYEAAVKKELEDGRLKCVELEDFELSHDFTFIWRKDSIYSDYYRELYRLLRGAESRVKC